MYYSIMVRAGSMKYPHLVQGDILFYMLVKYPRQLTKWDR